MEDKETQQHPTAVGVLEDTQTQTTVPSSTEVDQAGTQAGPSSQINKEHPENKAVRGRPFPEGTSGNPAGRPRGARNRTTLAAEQLLDGEAEVLTRKLLELAKDGNVTALRLCVDRIIPARRDRLIVMEMPELNSVEDAPEVIKAIAKSVTAGELGIAEGIELAKLVESYVSTKQGTIRHNESAARFSDAEKRREEDRDIEEILSRRGQLKE